MNICIVCNSELSGKQVFYCSKKCKIINTNNKYKKYELQRKKGFDRKLNIFISRGGKCEICGYKKNLSAIDFHHIEKDKKLFKIDIRQFSNRKYGVIEDEISKCLMICANCHREIHNPEFNI